MAPIGPAVQAASILLRTARSVSESKANAETLVPHAHDRAPREDSMFGFEDGPASCAKSGTKSGSPKNDFLDKNRPFL